MKIAKPDDAWIDAQVQSALDVLKSTDADERRQAVRTLRFLSERQAVVPLTSLVGEADLAWEAFMGLVGARDLSQARAALLEGFRQPEIAVTDAYLHALEMVSASPREPVISYDGTNTEALRQQYEGLQAAQATTRKEALAELSNALPLKRGRAQATTCAVLLRHDANSPGLRETFAGLFRQLTEDEQRRVLEYQWDKVRCPAFQGPLEQILTAPGSPEVWNMPQLRSWAVRRFLDVQPEEARKLILEDMQLARPLLAGQALLALPDESLPEMDDVFVAHMASIDGDRWKLPALIERYATKRVLADVTALYQKSEGRWACDIEQHLLGYWVKHDPETGLAAVKRAALLREHTGCFRMVLGNVLSRYYSPAAETLALSFLDDSDGDVVMDVLQLLARQGLPTMIDPLLAHLKDVKDDDESLPGMSRYSNATVRRQMISCMFQKRDWSLTEAQKETLYTLLKNDAERAWFSRRFPDVATEQDPSQMQ